MAAHETAVGSKAEAERRAGDDFTRVHGTVIEVTELDGYIGDDSVVLYAPKGRPFRVRVTDTNVQDILRWMDRHHLDPFWDVELVEDHPDAYVDGEKIRSTWVYGHGYFTSDDDASPREPQKIASGGAQALDEINLHRRRLGQTPLDPASVGWSDQDVLDEAERVRRLPNVAGHLMPR